MPINPTSLSSPEPDPEPDVAAPEDPTPQQEAQADLPKRTRRTKAQMIADAVIPANDDQIELKDAGTGSKIQRPWLVALEMVRDGKAEFVDREMKYSMQKWDQAKSGDEPAAPIEQPKLSTPAEEQIAFGDVPPDAEVGDEVSIGSDTFRVGHGRVLVDGSSRIAADGEVIPPARRWIRQIGSGPNGPWEQVPALGGGRRFPPKNLGDVLAESAFGEKNGTGDAEVQVQTERLPREVEQVDTLTWKISSGILEKIGLPQVEQYAGGSQLQVGPISVSRYVIDDGRRTTVELNGGRQGEVPVSVIEAFEVLDNTVEFVASRFRGQLQDFLAATGVLKQPVSA